MSPHRIARWQLVSGLFNAWVWAAVAWALCGGIGGWSTPGIGRLGGLCGWTACLLAPFGWVEIALALWARSAPDAGIARRRVRSLAWLEVGSVLLGGVPAAIVGGAVLWGMREPDVRPAAPR
jgi:hypothetical protein